MLIFINNEYQFSCFKLDEFRDGLKIWLYSFMHFTQSRIGLIDTFGVFFIFVSYFYLYRFIKKQYLPLLLLSGVFFGLAAAVKWSAVFGAFGYILIALYLVVSHYPMKKAYSRYRIFLWGILVYGVLATLVYFGTYADALWRSGGNLKQVFDYQINMYDYHHALQATHPYSSPWWSWPIDYKPMCYSREIHGDRFQSITAFGNPAIFWAGVIAMLYLIYSFVKKRDLNSAFILSVYAGLFLPYAIVGRIMFIYHYYYAVPFMMLGIIYMFQDITLRYDQSKKHILIYFAIVSLLFLAYYPVLSGYEIYKPYVDNFLVWFSGWWL